MHGMKEEHHSDSSRKLEVKVVLSTFVSFQKTLLVTVDG